MVYQYLFLHVLLTISTGFTNNRERIEWMTSYFARGAVHKHWSTQSSQENPYSLEGNILHYYVWGIQALSRVRKGCEAALFSNILPLYGHDGHSISPAFHTHAMNIRPGKLVTLLRWNVNISRMDLVGSQLFPMANNCSCVEESEEYNHC